MLKVNNLIDKYVLRAWDYYEYAENGPRFMIFLFAVAIPMSLLMGYNPLAGMIYGLFMILFREWAKHNNSVA